MNKHRENYGVEKTRMLLESFAKLEKKAFPVLEGVA